MAAASAAEDNKENTPPASGATGSAVAASRRHGYAVKSCGVKKKRASSGRLLGRVPLRDIINLVPLIVAVSAVAGPEAPAPRELEVPSAVATELATNLDAVVGTAALQGGGDSAGHAATTARYSLLKGFR